MEERSKIENYIENNRLNLEKIVDEYSVLLKSLNSAFIRYESETSDKFKTLFDTRKDFLEHKNLFLHELAKLNKDCS